MLTHRRTFLKQLGFGALGFEFVFSLPESHAAFLTGHTRLPRSSPEAEGVSSEAIVHFLEAVSTSKHEFHSFMMLRHGRVIADAWWAPYRAEPGPTKALSRCLGVLSKHPTMIRLLAVLMMAKSQLSS